MNRCFQVAYLSCSCLCFFWLCMRAPFKWFFFHSFTNDRKWLPEASCRTHLYVCNVFFVWTSRHASFYLPIPHPSYQASASIRNFSQIFSTHLPLLPLPLRVGVINGWPLAIRTKEVSDCWLILRYHQVLGTRFYGVFRRFTHRCI